MLLPIELTPNHSIIELGSAPGRSSVPPASTLRQEPTLPRPCYVVGSGAADGRCWRPRAEVGQVRVATCLHGQLRPRRRCQVRGHHQGSTAIEGEGRDQHPPIPDRHQLLHSRLRLARQQATGSGLSGAGSKTPWLLCGASARAALPRATRSAMLMLWGLGDVLVDAVVTIANLLSTRDVPDRGRAVRREARRHFGSSVGCSSRLLPSAHRPTR